MDRTAINELFHFTDYSWRAYEELIRPLGDEMLTRPAPGSGWPALRDALAHTNWAYIRWLERPKQTTEGTVPVITSWPELDAYRRRVRDHARHYLDSLTDTELTARGPMEVNGQSMTYSPADIFVHVLLHERQHHGDLNTLLYQLGLEVPVIEYRFSLA
jgi:uncharacterized damage-inducible protein DinB